MIQAFSSCRTAIAIVSLLLISGCHSSQNDSGSSEKGVGQPVKMSGGISEWLSDGKVALTVTSFERDTMMFDQPVTYYQIKMTLKNDSEQPLTLDEVKTEYLASDLTNAPFVNTFSHTSNQDDPAQGKAAWTIEPNGTDDIPSSGHFFFAKKNLKVRVTLLDNGATVGGPFVIAREPDGSGQ